MMILSPLIIIIPHAVATAAYLYNYLIPAWDDALRNSILLWKDISLDAVKGNTTSLLLVYFVFHVL
jgi:hypothetical protein